MRTLSLFFAGLVVLLVGIVACSEDTYPEAPSANASISSFTLHGVLGNIDTTVNPHRITVVFPSGQSLDGLVAVFTLPAGARAYVGTTEQISGSTANSYSAGYLAWVIKAADGSLREYRVYASAGVVSSSSSSLSATSSSGSASSTSIEPTSQVGNILITEWADAGPGVDYIELRNFSTSSVTIDSSLSILFGASFGTSVTLAKYGTGDDPASYTAFTSLSLAAGEVIIVVESDVTTANIQTIKGYGAPVNTKFFVSTEATMIGTGDRLSDNPAKLKSGVHEWSQTPWPWTVGTTTYSLLISSFAFGVDSTQDAAKWINGTASIKTTGVWP